MDLDDAVGELYGLPPEAFLEARRELVARAKGAKDTGLAKAVESVRKPTAAAYAVNLLVRRRPDDVERMLALAGRLQEAQEKMDGAALKTLGRERTALIGDLVTAASEVVTEADGALSAAVASQVRDTFVAALATTAAAEAVSSGQLTRGLTYAGFGDVDLSEATAAPAPARRPALRVIAGGGESGASRTTGAKGAAGAKAGASHPPDPEPEDEPQEPDPALLQRLSVAEKRSRETMSAAAKAGDALSEASEALEALDQRIAQLDAELKSARAGRDDLLRAHKEAVAADKTAERTLRAALAEVDQIRAQLPDDD